MRARDESPLLLQGPCQGQPPYFGIVKRAMNRAPGPTDWWWAQHAATCGGAYSKVREPEGFGARVGTKRKRGQAAAAAGGGGGTASGGGGGGEGTGARVRRAAVPDERVEDEAAHNRRHDDARTRTLDAWVTRGSGGGAAGGGGGGGGGGGVAFGAAIVRSDSAVAPVAKASAVAGAPKSLPSLSASAGGGGDGGAADIVDLFDSSSGTDGASCVSDGGASSSGRCPVCAVAFPVGALAAHVDDCVVLCDN